MAKIKHQINRAKQVSRSCGNNKSCSYCRASRLHNARKKILETNKQVEEFIKNKET